MTNPYVLGPIEECEVCHALVSGETSGLHADWHREQDAWLTRQLARLVVADFESISR